MHIYGFQVIIEKTIVLFCLKIIFTFTNSIDTDEIQQYATFHLGLHCLHGVLNLNSISNIQ